MGKRDDGFTMVEVMATIALMGAVMGFAVTGWSGWSRSHAHQGAVVDVQATLRHAQQRAVTEGGALCVRFDTADDSWRLERGVCAAAPGTLVTGPWRLSPGLALTAPTFTHGTDTPLPAVTFTARGTASPGSVRVVRDDTGQSVEITVEGLTGRVSSS